MTGTGQSDAPRVPAANGTAPHWVVGRVETDAGPLPLASTRWTWREHLGAAGVRWNIGRNRYTVEPGLYAVGSPDHTAPLTVTANYKLSFDVLRRALDGLDAWVLVLDTLGINVWCAAGKGTFGTDELVHRIEETNAKQVVSHSTLVLPQLGAPGVAAHDVAKRTGFKVVYGPVRAVDLPAFLHAGMQATPSMRRVQFKLGDRLAVVPVEMVQGLGRAFLIMLGLFLACGLGRHGYRLAMDRWPGIAIAFWSVYFAGTALTPALLPWLPGRAFSVKGAILGLAVGAALWGGGRYSVLTGLSVMLLSVSACSYLSLMFTGCTPYTSMSGVRRELKWAIRLQIAVASVGLLMCAAAQFV